MKIAIFRKPPIMIFLLVILSMACSSQVTVYETPIPPNVETLVAETLVVLTENAPKSTDTPKPTDTSVPASATPQEFGEIYILTSVDNVNLRVNPGMLFQVSRVLPNGTRLRLLGYAPGREWLEVMNDEGVVGWVNVNFVTGGGFDGPPPPVIEPDGVILVTGSVVTELGSPVSGVGYAVYQGSRRTDAITDEKGRFYAYLPPTMTGNWTVEYVSIACTSNTMDVNCNCISGYCGSSNPSRVDLQLPQVNDLVFIWK